MDAMEVAAGTGDALSQAISFLNCQKEFPLFHKDDSQHRSLDFPFQEQYEKININFFVQKEFLFAFPLTFPGPSTSAFH